MAIRPWAPNAIPITYDKTKDIIIFALEYLAHSVLHGLTLAASVISNALEATARTIIMLNSIFFSFQ
jgi:hypothetical protein